MLSSKVIELRIAQATRTQKTQQAALDATKARIAKLKKDLADAKKSEKTSKPAPKKKAAKKKVAKKKAAKKATKKATKKAKKK